jgi:hypothetical protein
MLSFVLFFLETIAPAAQKSLLASLEVRNAAKSNQIYGKSTHREVEILPLSNAHDVRPPRSPVDAATWSPAFIHTYKKLQRNRESIQFKNLSGVLAAPCTDQVVARR